MQFAHAKQTVYGPKIKKEGVLCAAHARNTPNFLESLVGPIMLK